MCQTGGTLETAAERKVRGLLAAVKSGRTACTLSCPLLCGAVQIRAPRMPAPIYGKYGAASRSLMVRRSTRCARELALVKWSAHLAAIRSIPGRTRAAAGWVYARQPCGA